MNKYLRFVALFISSVLLMASLPYSDVRAATLAVPVIQSPTKNSVNPLYLRFSGTGVPGARVRVVVSGYPTWVLLETLVNANGQWQGQSTTARPVGVNSVSSQQTLDGRSSDWGLNVSFTVIDVLPVPVMTYPARNAMQFIYPEFSGTGIPGALVQVVVTGYPTWVLTNALVDANGRWQGRSTTARPVGLDSVSSKQTLNGKSSDWGPDIAFKVTDVPPVSVITFPARNGTQSVHPVFSGNGEPGARVKVVVSGYPTWVLLDTLVNADGRWQGQSATARPVGLDSVSSQQTLNGKSSDWGLDVPFYVVDGNSGIDGQRIANELNQMYSTTSNTCPGNKAAFYCSGVLIRTVDDSTAFHAWNPSPGAVNLGGVSFSYMKIGIGMNQLQGSRTQGFVLEPAQSFTANGGYPLQVLCSYPYDAGTLIRSGNGCGAASNFPSNSGACAAQGINTLASWRAHFQQYPSSSTNRYHHQCSFATDQAGFALSLNARDNPAAEAAAWRQNEVMIKTWPQNTNNLPIKAFFYFLTANRAVGIEGAKNIQRDFFKMTGRKIPIVRITPNVTDGNIFSYFSADQGI